MTRNVVLICFSQDLVPRHESMVASMLSYGHKVTVVNWVRAQESQKRIDGVTYLPLEFKAPFSSLRLLLYLRSYYRCVNKHLSDKGEFDLCVLTHIMMLPLFSRVNSRKFVYDISEYLNYDLSDYFGFLSKIVRPFIEVFEKRYIKKVDGVTYVGSREGWLKNYVRKAPESLEINNFPDLTRKPSVARVEELQEYYSGKKVAIYVGDISHERGVDQLIDAVELVIRKEPQTHFILMGRGRDISTGIFNKLNGLGIATKVEVLDHRSFDEMLAYLQVASVGIALYQIGSRRSAAKKFDRFNSRKILTYMQSGLPVLVSNGNPFSRFVLECECGEEVDPNDLSDLARKMISLLNHGEEKGRRGLIKIQTELNWQNEEKRFLQFLEKI